ncbi:MAG: FAD-dependent oxidoreductase [Actinomycetota bacterium]
MAVSVLILGAGFGGLECASRLAGGLGDDVEITLIDRADAFVFGFAKLDVMFGRRSLDEVRIPYASLSTPRVRFRQETITSIDPEARRVTTDLDAYEADVLVIALGADYDLDATPGLREAGNEFYSVEGARALREALPTFTSGEAVVGVCGPSFKCPPAPSEAAFLLDHYLRSSGRRDATTIHVVMPFGVPIPPSPETSAAILTAFAERGISYVADRRVASVDGGAREVVLDDGGRLPYDLFLGIPVHRVPDVVEASGLAVDGWMSGRRADARDPVPGRLRDRRRHDVGTPKACSPSGRGWSSPTG